MSDTDSQDRSSQGRNSQDHSPQNQSSGTEAPHSYTAHNFEAMNRAIDTQIQKQELMSVIYRNQRYENSTRTILFVVSAISIASLSAALIWWLLFPGHPSYQQRLSINDDNPALITLSGQEQINGDDAPFIDTSFTVFHRNLTPSGDYVVTGKTYVPNDLNTPNEQYCYLEAANPKGELSAKPLAAYEGEQFKWETTEPLFIELAEDYCRFSHMP